MPRSLRRRTAVAIIPALGALAGTACATRVGIGPRGLPSARPVSPIPLAVPLAAPALRLLVPTSYLPAGFVLTEELVPRLDWRSPQEDPWGRVASYAATFIALAPPGASSTAVAPSLRTPPGGEITISLNSYLDPDRAAAAFAEWQRLVPRTYTLVARGPWRDAAWAPAAALAAYTTERPRASLVGFCAGPLLGSVRLAVPLTDSLPPPDDREATGSAGPTAVTLDLARRVAESLRATLRSAASSAGT